MLQQFENVDAKQMASEVEGKVADVVRRKSGAQAQEGQAQAQWHVRGRGESSFKALRKGARLRY